MIILDFIPDVLVLFFFGILLELTFNKHNAQECCVIQQQQQQSLLYSCRNKNRKYMINLSMLISTGGVFVLVWLPESIGNAQQCSFNGISNPLERKIYLCPISLGNLSLSYPLTPQNFHDPSWGRYRYFLEPCNTILIQ